MLIVELSVHLSQNKVLGGHRRLQKLLLLADVGCLPCGEAAVCPVQGEDGTEGTSPHICTGHTPETCLHINV